MKFSIKSDWVLLVLVGVGIVAAGMAINYLWGEASKQGAGCWFNKYFHTTKSSCGPQAQGRRASEGPSCPGPVPASAGVCDSQEPATEKVEL